MNIAVVTTLLAALSCSSSFTAGQIIYEIADCADLQAVPTIAADAVIDFTASPISCDSLDNTLVEGGVSLELTSSVEALELINVRFKVLDGSALLVSVPALQWQSELTTEGETGAALSVEEGCTATFVEDVTFTGCSSSVAPSPTYEWVSSGAISNLGNLEFMKDATITGTTEGGGLYNSGSLTFHGDAWFEDNKKTNNYINRGGGLMTYNGEVTFKGAASFVGNEVVGTRYDNGEEVGYQGGSGGGFASWSDVVFEGPVLFSGNKALEGAGLHVLRTKSVTFQDHVTFESNVATAVGDASAEDASNGGGMAVDSGTVEFQSGFTATGNMAKNGGGFSLLFRDAAINVSGPVYMSDNEARYQGGAIWNKGTITIPQDAYISGNTAIMCPGIKNWEDWEQRHPAYTRSWDLPDGSVYFSGGSTYQGSSKEICYLGEDSGNGPDSTIVIDSGAADCDMLFGEGTMLHGYSILTWDTRVVSAVQLAVGTDDFEITCAHQTIIFVTGGGEVKVSSTSGALTISNIRFEIVGYSSLYFDVEELTMTGIDRSVVGGSTHVDKGSSLEFWWDVKFIDNTVAYMSNQALNEYGGAAMFNAGSVIFRGQAYFRGNGQFEQYGMWVWNSPGGAILNIGVIQFAAKAAFKDSFSFGGGHGGGVANSGEMSFDRRTVWRNNTVIGKAEYQSSIYGGHGAALYNFGPAATTTFYSKATFKENVGVFRGCAVGADGSSRGSSVADITNKITFEHKTFFKDNSCNVEKQDTGGAGLWVYGNATVEFQDRAVFRRNEAINGGAIMNGGGMIDFLSADLIDMTDNIGVESCPDIKNYDKDRQDHDNTNCFGDINDPDATDSETQRACTLHLGEVTIGGDDPIVGESLAICEF